MYKRQGKTIATFLLISICTDLITTMTRDMVIVSNDKFLSSVYGGAILGLGVLLTFKAGSTSAGTDVIARVLAKGHNIKTSHMIIAVDSVSYTHLDVHTRQPRRWARPAPLLATTYVSSVCPQRCSWD